MYFILRDNYKKKEEEDKFDYPNLFFLIIDRSSSKGKLN